MANYMDYPGARFALVSTVNRFLAETLKNLLEEKHLYQSSTRLDFNKLYSLLEKQVVGYGNQTSFEDNKMLAHEWFRPAEIELQEIIANRRGPAPTLLVQNVKLYCSHCQHDETFSPIWYTDVSNAIAERHAKDHRIASPSEGYQLYSLTFQCETCKAIPVSFLICRREWKLTIEGRSPFEEVELPAFIPKTEAPLLADAIVAAQCSKTLAALFYLRAFIEQFARRQTKTIDRRPGDQILDAYHALLPEGRRDHMPSLRALYEKLSEALHEARADEELFEKSKADIIEHFDFRRLYRIQDGPT